MPPYPKPFQVYILNVQQVNNIPRVYFELLLHVRVSLRNYFGVHAGQHTEKRFYLISFGIKKSYKINWTVFILQLDSRSFQGF